MTHICFPSRYESVQPEIPMSRGMTPLRRLSIAGLMFLGAYFTTVTVNAQDVAVPPANQGIIALNSNDAATVTGTIKEADDDYLIVTSAGKDVRIDLSRVKMSGEADDVFTPGMNVAIDGEMTGNDFGTPVVQAYNVTTQQGVAQ